MRTGHTVSSFIIEGNIGAGKSTLALLIQKYLDVHVVLEPHDQWQSIGGQDGNILLQFYNDPKRWSYTFQSYAYITRVREQYMHAQQYPHVPQVLERSIYSDRYCFAKNCFELGYMSNLEWQLYQDWAGWLAGHAYYPSGFIYLQADPELCYNRLKIRNRNEEASVPIDYLKSLHDKHEAWLIKKEGIGEHLKKTPVLVIDGDQEFEHDARVREKVVNEIKLFIASTQEVQHYDSQHVIDHVLEQGL